MRTCLHEKCGRELKQRNNETDEAFAIREHCNIDCRVMQGRIESKRATAARKEAAKRPPETKPCEACGIHFERPARTAQSTWELTKTCKKPECITIMKVRAGKIRAQRKAFDYAPIPEPEIHSVDVLTTRTETPLDRGMDLYRLRRVVGWLTT